MKAFIFRDIDSAVHVKLIAETQDEREQLIREASNESMAEVNCEEWREAAEAQTNGQSQ